MIARTSHGSEKACLWRNPHWTSIASHRGSGGPNTGTPGLKWESLILSSYWLLRFNKNVGKCRNMANSKAAVAAEEVSEWLIFNRGGIMTMGGCQNQALCYHLFPIICSKMSHLFLFSIHFRPVLNHIWTISRPLFRHGSTGVNRINARFPSID